MEEKLNFSKGGRVKQFITKYLYLFVVLLLIVGITLAIVFSTLSSNNSSLDPDDTDQTNTTPVVWGLPLVNATVAHDYFADELDLNTTLGLWETHRGIDFLPSENNMNVKAVLDGTVTAVTSSFAFGKTVEITHAGGYKTVYSALADSVPVKVGDSIIKGQTIGTVGNTAENESDLGSHLHFEVFKNNEWVNPGDYLDLGNK